ncbi:MAG: metalloregulator ArsR/SmtB family transcription factor [Defluviitaleaceae bacterium]|nr:metalloregulator ArsR/SmtB family transcription factor [Defluviitaleaceae bacterium]
MPCCVDPQKVSEIKDSMLNEEVVYDIADFFKVFGDSTRLKILFALKDGPVCVGDLSAALGIGQSAVSHQLRVLRQSDIVKFRKEGKVVYYELDDSHVETVLMQALHHMMHV